MESFQFRRDEDIRGNLVGVRRHHQHHASTYSTLIILINMDAGWPTNPSNGIFCILCKTEIYYDRNNPEVYFRHLIREHCCFYNLNLLLELCLAQPSSVSQETELVNIKQEALAFTEPSYTQSSIWNYNYKGRQDNS